ncbi:hypothetical protein EDB92DRAFT_1818855 [Lactarius akahatsu]|uniref:Uncharacterized protein n=1 Tax=Lactarius akahatsu TaxID=416441 RepID=A0AAD4L8X9_9AGAM|nr:hypothetical protein EDB92DRAFT_1818855 [Lactarius akahatsu]
MVLSILNTDPSRRDTENLPPHKLLASPQKPKTPNGRSRAHNIPGGIKHLLSDPKRRRRVSARSSALLFPSRTPSRSIRPRGKLEPPRFNPPSRSVSLFRDALPDLPHKQISAEVISSLGFTSQVPTQYIRDQMDRLSLSMYQALRSTNATASGATLPKTLLISVNDASSAMLPTHMAAVYSSAPSAPEPRRVMMYPVHQSILSLYCANLPVLPSSTPRPTTPISPFQVPVVPLALPHPESFPVLTQFLYLKGHAVTLPDLSLFNPSQRTARSPRPDANYTAQRLASQAVKVHGLWRNACVLGIFDIALQTFFDLAWEVLMKALILSSNRAPTTAVVSA